MSRAIAALVVLCVVSTSLPAQLAAPVRRGIDSVFLHLDRTDAPGCAVGVSERGRMVYTRGYGMADLQHRIAIGPQSIFHVASVSKQFTAIAVALLAEEGRLSLDDDVRKYVPELPAYEAPITIRQLMHHTSGLRDQWNLLGYAGWRFPTDLITEQDVLQIVIRQKGLNFRPGAEYLYSNTGFTLLAIIVQRTSGHSLAQYAQARFFGPLGMHNTHFHDDYSMIVPGRTSAYAPREGGGWRISIPTFDTYGATSLFSTAEDLLLWMASFDNAPEGASEILRAAQTSAVLTDGTPTNYGYGLTLNTWRGVRAIGHGGADAGYRAYVERYPDFGVGVAVLCNAANAGPNNLARAVAARVLADRLPREMVEARAPVHLPSDAARAAWVGVYRDTVAQAILRVRVSGDTAFANAAPLIFGSDTTATTASMEGWYSLQPRGGLSTIRVNPKGTRQRVFVRQPEALANPSVYAGTYSSAELDVQYVFTVRDGALRLFHRKLGDLSLQPAGRDAFTTASGSTLLFQRDRRGRLTGFTLNDARVRGVSFVRVP
jgi:CubicO group peptidase (beta-lactamase class C family)